MTTNNIAAFASGNREFDLHLHVLEHRCEGGAPRYTIGIWEQTTQGAGLRAICHIRPLPDALLAIMDELDKGARHKSVEIATKHAASPTHSCAVRDGSLAFKTSPRNSIPITPHAFEERSDAPSCQHCGCPTKRNGSCYVCGNCGASTGCS
jgi:hypothetical protein